MHFNKSPTHNNTTDRQKVLHHPPTLALHPASPLKKTVNSDLLNQMCFYDKQIHSFYCDYYGDYFFQYFFYLFITIVAYRQLTPAEAISI